MLLLYNFLLVFGSPLWVPWMLVRTFRRAKRPNWDERCGRYASVQIPKDTHALWVHAVSVGEVIAALPILRELRQVCPEHHVVLSVTTSSGHHTAEEQAMGLYDSLVYMPIDLLRFQMSALMRVRPDVVAIMETELWMNFVYSAKSLGANTLLINGRISDRSFPLSMKLRFFYRSLLTHVDRCLMQSQTDADRITALGATSAEVLGNVKFDQAVEGLDASPERWREALGLDPTLPTVLIGSSRGEAEEKLMASALKSLRKEINLVWAPRHLERAPAVVEALAEIGRPPARRSKEERGKTVVLDTYGELAQVYSAADIVVIGGSFADLGGQNIIQPLAHGKPVIHGPFMQNFREVTQAAATAGATHECSTSEGLAKVLEALLGDPALARKMGAAGAALVQSHLGASKLYAQAIAEAAKTAKALP